MLLTAIEISRMIFKMYYTVLQHWNCEVILSVVTSFWNLFQAWWTFKHYLMSILSVFHFRLAMASATCTPEEVTNSFSCAVCLEQFKDPKALQCLHTYCKKCLVKLVKKKGSDHVIPCPECREDTKVSKLLSTTALFSGS